MKRLTVEVDLVVDDTTRSSLATEPGQARLTSAEVESAVMAAIGRVGMAGSRVSVAAWRVARRHVAHGPEPLPLHGRVRVEQLPDPPGAEWSAVSTYVEVFWLPIIGPTPTLALRHLAGRLGRSEGAAGFDVDLAELAAELGVGGPALNRSIHRLTSFGLADTRPGALRVATQVPRLSQRKVHRLPGRLAAAHDRLAFGPVPA